MKDKVNRFNTTNILSRQQLFRISQACVSHGVTISALSMAKTVLFPFIKQEFALSKGGTSEKDALEVSKKVIDLFQTMLVGNTEESLKNLELIKKSQLSQELLDVITEGVNNQLKCLSLIGNGNNSKIEETSGPEKLLLFTKNDGSTSLVRYKKNLDNQN